MARRVIYFHVSVVSQRVENPVLLFPSSCRQHWTHLLSICCPWPICTPPSPLLFNTNTTLHSVSPCFLLHLEVDSFFITILSVLMSHSGEGSALLFCSLAIFLTFFLLVTFPVLTSYIISLFCFQSLSL